MNRFRENDIISLVGAPPRYELGESIGPDLRLADVLDTGVMGAVSLGYGTAAGDPALRAAIAAAHGVDLNDVVVTAGGMHALFLLAFVLCGHGDEATIATPCFPLARNALEAVGAHVRELRQSFDTGYRFNPDDLRTTLSPRTRLVILTSPQNPSGVAISASAVCATLDLMAEISPDACLVIDETYREAAYGDNPVAESALALGRKVVSVASLSKCHGAPGLRIGWAITRNAALRKQLVVAKFNTVVSCPPLEEALALRLLQRCEPVLAERRALLDAGLQQTAAWVRANADHVEWVRPDAGAICCIRLSEDWFDDDAVSRFYEVAAANGARVARGAWFGEEARVFRLGFALLSATELGDALAVLTDALRATVITGGRP